MNNKQKNDIDYYLNLPYTLEVKEMNDGDGKYFFIKVKELEGCMSHGDSIDEAYEMIKDAMTSWIEAALDDLKEIPLPESLHEDNYSGKFIVRVPKTLHKQLVEKAKNEGVSLNLYINDLLSTGNTLRH